MKSIFSKTRFTQAIRLKNRVAFFIVSEHLPFYLLVLNKRSLPKT